MKKISDYKLRDKAFDCFYSLTTFVLTSLLFFGVCFVFSGWESNPDSVFFGVLAILIMAFSVGWAAVGIAWMLSGLVFLSSLPYAVYYFFKKIKAKTGLPSKKSS